VRSARRARSEDIDLTVPATSPKTGRAASERPRLQICGRVAGAAAGNLGRLQWVRGSVFLQDM